MTHLKPTRAILKSILAFSEVSGLSFDPNETIKNQYGVLCASSDGDNIITAYSPSGTDLDWQQTLGFYPNFADIQEKLVDFPRNHRHIWAMI